MACGHEANGVRILDDGRQIACCVICAGIGDSGGETPVESPDLTGRYAVCSYARRVPIEKRVEQWGCDKRSDCRCIQPSDGPRNLAFFKYNPNHDFDEYYCGCWGWD